MAPALAGKPGPQPVAALTAKLVLEVRDPMLLPRLPSVQQSYLVSGAAGLPWHCRVSRPGIWHTVNSAWEMTGGAGTDRRARSRRGCVSELGLGRSGRLLPPAI